MNSLEIPNHDLTIADVIRITGMSRNRAYGLRFWGEYHIGNSQKSRRIRYEEFIYRRNNGLNIVVEEKKLHEPS